MKPFVHFMNTGRPLVTVKAALTLDGKIAAPQDKTAGSPAKLRGRMFSRSAIFQMRS